MDLNDAKKRAEAATVRLTRLKGQGVLVPGGFVLTAAHCVGWTAEGGMTLGDYFYEPITTNGNGSFRVSVDAIEPVADIAALREVDGQVLYDDCAAFEIFCEATPPVRCAPMILNNAARYVCTS
jgi:hypothetical protein